MKDSKIHIGIIIEALPSCKFRIKEDGVERILIVYLSGKMRSNFIKVLIGDRVEFNLSPDKTNGRIIKRL